MHLSETTFHMVVAQCFAKRQIKLLNRGSKALVRIELIFNTLLTVFLTFLPYQHKNLFEKTCPYACSFFLKKIVYFFLGGATYNKK